MSANGRSVVFGCCSIFVLNTFAKLSNAIIVSFLITIADAGCGFFSASTISSAALEISSFDDI